MTPEGGSFNPESRLEFIQHTEDFLNNRGGIVIVPDQSMLKLINTSCDRQENVSTIKIRNCRIDKRTLQQIIALDPNSLELNSCLIMTIISLHSRIARR